MFCCCALQEQYQYLYKAMLSLVSSREWGPSIMYMEPSEDMALVDVSDPAESMESLVWGGPTTRRSGGEALDLWRKQRKNKLSSNFGEGGQKKLLWGLFRQTELPYYFFTLREKSFLIFIFCHFSPFSFFRLYCSPAECTCFVFKLKWGKSSSVQFALHYQCYCLNPIESQSTRLTP